MIAGDGPGPAVLAAGARRALQPSAGWGPAWPRAAAFLARQALEDSVERSWYGAAAGMRDCNMAAQLVSLPFYLEDRELGRRVRQCWASLSSACHAHPYELAPTVSELEGWLEVVDEVTRAVGFGPEAASRHTR
jgi:hypothetical protein